MNVPIRRTMHLSSVIPANDTRESVFGLRNFPRRERGSNLGPLAPEASALTTELPRFSCRQDNVGVGEGTIKKVAEEHFGPDTLVQTATPDLKINKSNTKKLEDLKVLRRSPDQ